jgi:hypothetical protein
MSSYLTTTASVQADRRAPKNRTYRRFSDARVNNVMASIHGKNDDEDDLSAYAAAPASTFSGGSGGPAPFGMNINHAEGDVDADLRNMQRSFSSVPAASASTVAPQYQQQQQQQQQYAVTAMSSDAEKLDYIIRILDERQVATPTDDVVMYAILGICAIYVVDGLMRK